MKVWNKRDKACPKTAIYIGRPSKWGNPFYIGKDGNRSQVIAKYEAWLEEQVLLGNLDPTELKGKDLVCWCKPLPCHGDILVKFAERR